MKVLKLFLPFVMMISLLGCTTHVGKFSYISTKDMKTDTSTAEKVGTNVLGEDAIWFIIINPTLPYPQMDKALDDALKKAGGDFMTNATITYKYFMIPILYTRVWYEVVGDVWKMSPKVPITKH
jgi:hypothetical protein